MGEHTDSADATLAVNNDIPTIRPRRIRTHLPYRLLIILRQHNLIRAQLLPRPRPRRRRLRRRQRLRQHAAALRCAGQLGIVERRDQPYVLAARPQPVRGAEEEGDEGAQHEGDAAPLLEAGEQHGVAEAGASARAGMPSVFLCVCIVCLVMCVVVCRTDCTAVIVGWY